MPTAPARHRPVTGAIKSLVDRGRRLYDSRRWRTVSQGFLHHHPLCASCEAQGKVEPATCVDHIRPHRGDQAMFWDSANWQPLCHTCHGLKTSMETRGTAAYVQPSSRIADTIVILAGPPGSGRLAYAQMHARPGDVIVDEAGIAAAWAGTPRHEAGSHWGKAAQAERNRILARMAKEPARRVWLIVDAPMHGQRREWSKRLQASEVVVMAVDTEDCVRRAGQEVREMAETWWSKYSSGHDEVVLR